MEGYNAVKPIQKFLVESASRQSTGKVAMPIMIVVVYRLEPGAYIGSLSSALNSPTSSNISSQ